MARRVVSREAEKVEAAYRRNPPKTDFRLASEAPDPARALLIYDGNMALLIAIERAETVVRGMIHEAEWRANREIVRYHERIRYERQQRDPAHLVMQAADLLPQKRPPQTTHIPIPQAFYGASIGRYPMSCATAVSGGTVWFNG